MAVVSSVSGTYGGGGGVVGASFSSIAFSPYSWRLVRLGIRGITTATRIPGWARTAIAAGAMPGPIPFKVASAPIIAYGYWRSRNYARDLRMTTVVVGGSGRGSVIVPGSTSSSRYAAGLGRRRRKWFELPY